MRCARARVLRTTNRSTATPSLFFVEQQKASSQRFAMFSRVYAGGCLVCTRQARNKDARCQEAKVGVRYECKNARALGIERR